MSTLLRSFEARRMSDAQHSTSALLRRVQAAARVPDFGPDGGDRNTEAEGTSPLSVPDDEPWPGWDREGRDGLARAIAGLIATRAPREGRAVVRGGRRSGISPLWATSDQVAGALLHLGRPAEARQIWECASDPPSPAIKLTRLATAALAALDFAMAETSYRAALDVDPARGEAWFGLALLHTQRGDAAGALAAARQGLRQALTPAQASFLRGIETLTARHQK